MSAVDRRDFLKGLAAVTATAAGAGARTVDAQNPLPKAAQRVTWTKAPCPLCSVGCGLLVGVEKERVVALKGDPDSSVSRGLACAKGYHAGEMLYGADRITRAMIRRDGRLQPVPMKEALDLIAQRIRETQAKHGKDSVALFGDGRQSLSDAHIGLELFRDALGSTSVGSSAGISGAGGNQAIIDAFGLPGSPGCFEDIDNADVFVLWNSNLAETHPVLLSRILERRRTSPSVRVVVLSTRATRTSYAADEAFLMAPTTELFIANALCQDIVARKLHHRDFLNRYVAFKRADGSGTTASDAARDATRASEVTFDEFVAFLGQYTPARAEAVSGVPAESIRWLASVFGDRARKVMSIWGEGVDGGPRGVWSSNALYNLHLLVGKIGVPGSGPLSVSSGGVQPVVTGSPAVGATNGTANAPDVMPANAMASASDTIALFERLESGSVRFLWVQSANPMSELPNAGRYRRAAARADCFLVVTDAYPTATTDLADVVLPAALWVEAERLLVNGERRVGHVPALVPPPADAATASSQMLEVARRLNLKQLSWASTEYVGRVAGEYSNAKVSAARALPTLGSLRGTTGTLWPTTSGREVKWRYSSAHDPVTDRARGAFDFYGHQDHRAWIWLRPFEPMLEATDRSFPMLLEIGSVLEHSETGTITRRIPVLHHAVPNSYVELNRTDATRLGIRNGQRVRLTSRRGTVDIEARIDYRSQPAVGRLFAPVFDETALVRALMRSDLIPGTGQPDLTFCAVRIEPLSAGAR